MNEIGLIVKNQKNIDGRLRKLERIPSPKFGFGFGPDFPSNDGSDPPLAQPIQNRYKYWINETTQALYYYDTGTNQWIPMTSAQGAIKTKLPLSTLTTCAEDADISMFAAPIPTNTNSMFITDLLFTTFITTTQDVSNHWEIQVREVGSAVNVLYSLSTVGFPTGLNRTEINSLNIPVVENRLIDITAIITGTAGSMNLYPTITYTL